MLLLHELSAGVAQEFKECISSERDITKCSELREDYMECLHHKKEITRFNTILAEREKKIKHHEPVPPTVTEEVREPPRNWPHESSARAHDLVRARRRHCAAPIAPRAPAVHRLRRA